MITTYNYLMTDSKQRQDELRQILARLPEPTNIARMRRIAEILHIREGTVRGWLLKDPYRHIPARQLGMLKDALRIKS